MTLLPVGCCGALMCLIHLLFVGTERCVTLSLCYHHVITWWTRLLIEGSITCLISSLQSVPGFAIYTFSERQVQLEFLRPCLSTANNSFSLSVFFCELRGRNHCHFQSHLTTRFRPKIGLAHEHISLMLCFYRSITQISFSFMALSLGRLG